MVGRRLRNRPRGSGRRNAANAPEDGNAASTTENDSQAHAEDSTSHNPAASAGQDGLNSLNEVSEPSPASLAPRPPSYSAPVAPMTSTDTHIEPSEPSAASTAAAAIASTRSEASPRRGRKLLTRQPVNSGRRSKEGRDVLAQEAQEREKERKEEQAREARNAARLRERLLRNRGRGDRGGGRGRGGFMGDSRSVSGPFSGGKVAHDSKSKSAPSKPAAPKTPSSPKVKKEPSSRAERTQPAATSERNLKSEPLDGGYISSDPDEEAEGRVWNVGSPIRLHSDEENRVDQSGDEISKKRRHVPTGLVPIRVARKEHKDRIVRINTEASSASAAELRKVKTEPKNSSNMADAINTARKGKGKANDVEVLGSTKFRGMWQDDEDASEVEIKEEPTGGDGSASTMPTESNTAPVPPLPALKKRSSRTKTSHHIRNREPPSNFQTEEEREEWQRHSLALETLRDELGYMGRKGDSEESAMDLDTELGDQRTDRVYLFQLPPIVPDLQQATPKIKKEPSSSNMPAEEGDGVIDLSQVPPNVPADSSTQDAPVKIEEDVKPSIPGLLEGSNQDMPNLASGRAGKLRIHQSGRATLSWGGTSMEVHMGMPATFLQDVIVMRMPQTSFTSQADEEGVAMGLGQVRGKFVVTPDWGEIVG